MSVAGKSHDTGAAVGGNTPAADAELAGLSKYARKVRLRRMRALEEARGIYEAAKELNAPKGV